ncbi:MAG TPA: Uma2 family endonuclease [Chloroflexota bacterium]
MSAETRPIDAVRQPPPGKLTYEQFLDWCDEDTLAEWVDGEVIVTSPASLPHQDLAAFLTALLRDVAEADDLGKVLTAPFQMCLHDPAGRYQLALEGESGVYQSRALSRLRLPLEWLWQEPLPKLRDARHHLGLA